MSLILPTISGEDTRIEMPAMNQEMLTEAFKQGNLSHFRQALAKKANPLIRDPPENFSLFELICRKPGMSAFLDACIKSRKSDIPDTPNPNTGKHTINFLAESLDPANLETFLGYFPHTDVNVTYKYDSPIHLIVKSITKENLQECFDCVKILVKYGANVNIPDDQNFTPILTLARNEVTDCEDIIKYLLQLQHRQVELDEFRDGEARDILQTNYSEIPLPVKSECERNFDYFVKHLKYIQSIQIDKSIDPMYPIEWQKQEEIILSELRQYFDGMQNEEEKEKLLVEINSNGTLLGMAIKLSCKEVVKELLTRGADLNAGMDSKHPIVVACIYGQSEILITLLEYIESKEIVVNISDDPLLCLIVKNLGGSSYTPNCDYYKCFEVLLKHSAEMSKKHFKVDINQRDQSGSTALHYAVRYNEEEAIKALLERNAYLGPRNIFQDLPITDISPSLLEEHFNRKITTNKRSTGDEHLEISFDYSNLVPLDDCKNSEKFSEEMIPIYEMTKIAILRPLLKHPLISSFLFLKWHRLGPVFYANLLFYSISTLTIILYILLCYGREVSDGLRVFMLTISSLGVLFIIVREASQFITAPCQYLRQVENYLEMAIIGISIVVLTGYSVTDYTRRVIVAVLILLSAVELSLLVGSLPHLSISTHMVMLKTVSITFIRSLMFYSILLIAFAFCFYTLLGGISDGSSAQVEDEFNKFVDPVTAIIKTIVMMTGEFEAANIDFKSNTFSYLFFLLFVFFMSIVLFNLLNGLAVSDTQAIKAEAEFTSFITRAEVLRRYEKLVFGHDPGTLFRRFHLISKVYYFRKIARKFITLFPVYLPESKLVLSPNRNNRIHNHSTISKPKEENPDSYCFGCDKSTSLDGTIVRYTMQVLKRNEETEQEKKKKEEKQKTNLRILNMEKQLTENAENYQKLEIFFRDRVEFN